MSLLNKNTAVGEGAPDGCLGVLPARRQLDSQGRARTDGDGALARCACRLCVGRARGPHRLEPVCFITHQDHRGLPPQNQLGRQKFRPKTLLLASLFFQKKGNPPPPDRAFLPVSIPGSLLAE